MTIHVTVKRAAVPTLDVRLVRLLADPLRARLVALLAAEELCTCHLAQATGALPSAISNHLRQLKDGGVVESEPCGRYTYYRLRPQVLQALAVQLQGLAAAAPLAPRRAC